MIQIHTPKWIVVTRYVFILFLSLTASACLTEPQYSTIPQIEFKGFSRYSLEKGTGIAQQKRDSLVITIGFKDGDGNLGDNLPLTSLDSARYKQSGGWGNYKILAFRLENGQYKALATGENTTLFFPQLSREGQKGAIEGNLDLQQIYHYGNSYKNFVTKYRIQIRDRDLHVSNEIETDTITVPYSFQ